jgi:hypothetical protein
MILLRNRLSHLLPDRQSITLVFAVVSLVYYGRTFVSIFWEFNSWLKNLTSWEIVSIISSAMVRSFLEAAALMLVVLMVSIALPGKLLREKFVVRGSIVTICVLASLMIHLKLYEIGTQNVFVRSVGLWWCITLVLTALLAWFLPMVHIVEVIFYEIADRASIFLYILLPITLLGILIIAIRFLRMV